MREPNQTATDGLSEAEIQILASLDKAADEGLPSDRASLEAAGARFAEFLEDWTGAFESLATKGLIDEDAAGITLTAASQAIARTYNHERPDRYFYYYQKFYPAAFASAAHSKLCERVFGLDLCQEGQVDMTDLGELLAHLDIKKSDKVLDLGCGAGVISKYIADETGAVVTGLDYAATAIAEAKRRTAGESGRLDFIQADINQLDLPEGSFDAVVSLDTLYWVADLEDALGRVAKAVRAHGRIGVFIAQNRSEGDLPNILKADNTDFARALQKLGWSYEAFDYTVQNAAFWRRNLDAASDLRVEFEAEGNGFIAESLIEEAAGEFLPAFEAGTIARYLYHIRL